MYSEFQVFQHDILVVRRHSDAHYDCSNELINATFDYRSRKDRRVIAYQYDDFR